MKMQINDEEIIKLHSKGLAIKEIADRLSYNKTTVAKHIKKLGLVPNYSLRKHTLIKENIILSQEQLEIIYGSLLGDACISNGRLSFSQGGNQEKYFDYKCSFFEGLLGKINKTPRYDKRTHRYYNKFTVKFLKNKIYTEIYDKLYINGVKTITKEYLELLTPRSLAFWWMDDGSYAYILATNSFTFNECNLIKNWFKEKYNIDTRIKECKNNNHMQYLIIIERNSRQILRNLIKPYICESMLYKIK